MNVPATLIPTLVNTGLKIALDALRIRLEAEGRDEVTAADLENLRLEDPEDVIKKYQEDHS